MIDNFLEKYLVLQIGHLKLNTNLEDFQDNQFCSLHFKLDHWGGYNLAPFLLFHLLYDPVEEGQRLGGPVELLPKIIVNIENLLKINVNNSDRN